MRYGWTALCFCLAGCASGMTPISEPVLVQGFTVSNAANAIQCSGTYSRSPDQTEIIVPIACQDGRTGNIAIRTQPNGHPTVATVSLVDGSVAHATFQPILGDRHAYGHSSNLKPPAPAYLAKIQRQRAASAPRTYSPRTTYRRYYTGPRGGCYYINSNGNKTYVDHSFCR